MNAPPRTPGRELELALQTLRDLQDDHIPPTSEDYLFFTEALGTVIGHLNNSQRRLLELDALERTE